MKRNELRVGADIAVRHPRLRVPQRAVIVDLSKWRKGRTWPYSLIQDEKGRGIAIAYERGAGRWTPDVVPLNHVVSYWDDYEVQQAFEHAQQVRLREEREWAQEQLSQRWERANGFLSERGIAVPARYGNRITMDIDQLEAILNGLTKDERKVA